MAVLIDTNFLVAVASPKDTNHLSARHAMRAIKGERVVPQPVLPELFYLVSERVNYDATMKMFQTIRTGAFRIEAPSAADLKRMYAIMTQYADRRFDFVDATIMALSERLGITEIYTFDRRDFSVFVPNHCDYLELLP